MKPLFLATAAVLLLATSIAAATGLAGSTDKIKATATYTPHDDGAALCVHLDMQDGWHINTHPATLDFLVDTEIRASVAGQPLPMTVDWPQGQPSSITLDSQKLIVYAGNTSIPALVDGDTAAAISQAGQVDLDITVQACGVNGMCLMPATIELAVKPSTQALTC